MAVNRKARAQSRNDVTLDGDNDRGGSNGTRRDYDEGVPSGGTTESRMPAATSPGRSSGPKWPRSG